MNKSRIITFCIIHLLLVTGTISAQNISISNISNTKGFYNGSIEISGTGFNNTAGNLEVWFGASAGMITSASENLIICNIPDGATTSAITVLNKATGLTASSSKIFHPIYQGAASPDLTNLDNYNFPNAQELFDLVMVDLDKDGNNDLLATKVDNAATTVVAYRNVTTGANIDFVEQNITIGTPSLRVATGDIDGDSKQDIIITREGTSSDRIYVLRNTSTPGTISFAAPKPYQLKSSQSAKKIFVRDLDLDGKPEVVVVNSSDDEISIYKNSSTVGNINLSTTPTIINSGAITGNDLIIEDFDGDGKHDIAVTQFVSNDIRILTNNSTPGVLKFDLPVVIISLNGSIASLAAGDINEDGKIDLIVTDPFDNSISYTLNASTAGAISFGSPVKISSVASGATVALADFLGNGRLDIIVSSTTTDNFTLFENTGTAGTINLTKKLVPQPNRSRAVVVGDLSNDAKPDIAFTAIDATGTNDFIMAIRNTICITPEIISDASPSICNGQTFHFLTAPSLGANFIWKKEGLEVKNSADPFFDASLAGNYTVTAETEAGTCSVESIPVTLVLNTGSIPVDPIASNNGPACKGGTVTLSSTAVAGATYLWTGPLGFTSTDQNPVITNVTADMAGSYRVIAILSPCESGESITLVEVINPPDITVTSATSSKICTGESVDLTVGAATGYTYQWFNGGTLIAGATANTYSANSAGSYTVNMQGISNSCDLTSAPIAVTMFTAPSPVFTFSGTLCEGSTISFTETTVLETDKTAIYSWDVDGDGTEDYNTQNPTHIYPTFGTYVVELTIGYVGHTCEDFSTQSLTIDQSTAIFIQADPVGAFCEGDSVLLSIPTAGLSSATWSTGDQGFSTYAKVAGTYTVDATNTTGCISSDQIDLTTMPAPTITITPENSAIIVGQSAQFTASGADSYEWTPSETLDNPLIDNPTASPKNTTVYQVVGVGANGCLGTAETTVTVENTGRLPIVAPKMFSPNGDGYSNSDFWVIEGILSFPECTMTIFTRNGKIVYEKVRYENDWEGRDLGGNDLPEGAYYYTITCPDGLTSSGSVSIIR